MWCVLRPCDRHGDRPLSYRASVVVGRLSVKRDAYWFRPGPPIKQLIVRLNAPAVLEIEKRGRPIPTFHEWTNRTDITVLRIDVGDADAA